MNELANHRCGTPDARATCEAVLERGIKQKLGIIGPLLPSSSKPVP
jgi:hypothetical protein